MKICKIIVESQEDYEYLHQYVSKYPVELTQNYDVSEGIPTLIIGWSLVHNKYPQQNIIDKKISDNLSWFFSRIEKKDGFDKAIEEFINISVKQWLPKNFILFDPLFQANTLEEFISSEINTNLLSYIYFHKDTLYLYNNGKNIIMNIKSFEKVYDNYKLIITNFINKTKNLCLSYKNIANYIHLDKLNNVYTFEDAIWVKYNTEVDESYFNIVPGFDIKKHIPFILSKVSSFEFSEDEKKALRRLCVKNNITQWLNTRNINLKKEAEKNIFDFTFDGDNKLCKASFSNKRTITGRITSNGSFNPQNLDKKTEDRANIISRFKGGKIAVFDYTSFEARIALYFCGDNAFIEGFHNKDIHMHTAGIIFGNSLVTKENRAFAKNINHEILYGASKTTVMKQLSYLNNPEEVYYNITIFLAPLLKKSKELYEEFKERGYIINPWNTIVRPQKDYASFSNFISSSAVEILVDKLYEIKSFLEEGKYKSQFMFQVHDSLIFDIHPEEAIIVRKLAKLIMCYKDMFFNISYSSGYDYKNLSEPFEIVEYGCR